MKIAIFIDGQNFYRSMTRHDSSVRVDYDQLVSWLCGRAGSTFYTVSPSRFVGAHYYIAVAQNQPLLTQNFLKGLELRSGFFVHRSTRVTRTQTCRCGEILQFSIEKGVDTQLTADIIHHAAIGTYDSVVLVSGDSDFVPAVRAVNALGKQVWIATWSNEELSLELRRHAFGHITIREGMEYFRTQQKGETTSGSK